MINVETDSELQREEEWKKKLLLNRSVLGGAWNPTLIIFSFAVS